jgi:alpha-tubulin suppressor-like RCC1 family protein
MITITTCNFYVEDGLVYSWGGNGCGQLGLNHVDNNVTSPQLVPALSVKKVVDLATGTGCNHTLALCDDHTVFAWGCNARGQLGLTHNNHCMTPQQIPYLSDEKIEKIFCGGNGNGASFALTDSGDLFSFGWNENGQLGHGDTNDRNAPQQVIRLEGVEQVAAGGHHTLVLDRRGRVFSFGGNKFGQLGHNDLQQRESPAEVTQLPEVIHVAAGGNYSFCLTSTFVLLLFANVKQRVVTVMHGVIMNKDSLD